MEHKMNEHTEKLLEECVSGCKMAIGSMNQVLEFIKEGEQWRVIECYKEKHEKIEREAGEMLHASGRREKKPSAAASVFSWFTTEAKMMMPDDAHQAAKIMMDGCNMGIQSISEHLNDYTEASNEAVKLAKELIHMEETFVKELKVFL